MTLRQIRPLRRAESLYPVGVIPKTPTAVSSFSPRVAKSARLPWVTNAEHRSTLKGEWHLDNA